MASANNTPPTKVTISGRLSFPTWTYADALAWDAKSDFPAADKTRIAPSFTMIVEQAQLDKFIKFVEDEFLPYCVAQHATKEKRNALTPAQAERIRKQLRSDWTEQPPYIPIKPLHEKTAALAPDAVAGIRVKGRNGTDLVQKAVVKSEDELEAPDGTDTVFPVVKPIGLTVFSMYAGATVAATLNLYSYLSGSVPGFTASSGTVIFKADAEPFGGGGDDVDEDEIFLDA